jgi:hypothetical protein
MGVGVLRAVPRSILPIKALSGCFSSLSGPTANALSAVAVWRHFEPRRLEFRI